MPSTLFGRTAGAVGVGLTAVVFGSVAGAEPAARGSARPNVVLIVSDDLGYGDLGFQGGKEIPTPHLDALAAGGVKFTQAYVTGSICGPTRAGLHTGRYQQRHSYDGNPGPDAGLSLKEATLAESFKAGGYRTIAIGKWHLGQQPEYRPLQRGFHEFFGFYGAMHSYVPGPVDPSARMVRETGRQPGNAEANRASQPGAGRAGTGGATGVPGAAPGKLIHGNPREGEHEVDENRYLTEAFAQEAVSFVERNRAEPFFLYLSFNAGHSPLQPTPKYTDRFPKLTGKRRDYAATVSALDDAVGQVVGKIRELGLEENTVFYYTNDNGGPPQDIAADNTPLSGAKFSFWEGGIRVPSFVRRKGHLPEGKTFDAPVSSLDVFPTLLAAAGLETPVGKRFEGVNLLPALRSGEVGPLRDRTLYWRMNGTWAIRQGNLKLVLPERGAAVQLFDLERDIAENVDLSERNPEAVRRLTAAWKAWDAENLPVAAAAARPTPAREPGS